MPQQVGVEGEVLSRTCSHCALGRKNASNRPKFFAPSMARLPVRISSRTLRNSALSQRRRSVTPSRWMRSRVVRRSGRRGVVPRGVRGRPATLPASARRPRPARRRTFHPAQKRRGELAQPGVPARRSGRSWRRESDAGGRRRGRLSVYHNTNVVGTLTSSVWSETAWRTGSRLASRILALIDDRLLTWSKPCVPGFLVKLCCSEGLKGYRACRGCLPSRAGCWRFRTPLGSWRSSTVRC